MMIMNKKTMAMDFLGLNTADVEQALSRKIGTAVELQAQIQRFSDIRISLLVEVVRKNRRFLGRLFPVVCSCYIAGILDSTRLADVITMEKSFLHSIKKTHRYFQALIYDRLAIKEVKFYRPSLTEKSFIKKSGFLTFKSADKKTNNSFYAVDFEKVRNIVDELLP